MLKSRNIDRICAAVLVVAVAVTILFMFGGPLLLRRSSSEPEYVSRLFDSSRVHTIDLRIDDWAEFVANAPDEEYTSVTVVIDGETFTNVGIRAKGNNSRRLTGQYELSRYSLKLEFDRFVAGSYHGLDKFSLDASFQDNSYLKTYIAFDLMAYMGVPTPLVSFVDVTVNGEPWGLFLAVEEPEESFARRVYGEDHGELYSPDYRSLDDENADLDLRYIDDDPASYPSIFDHAKFSPTNEDKQNLIAALKTLSTGENLETAVNVDEVLRYFAAQVFVINPDSYVGRTGHNYFLYEKDGVLEMLPWDYNLAFGTYCLGMTDPISDPNVLINYPVNTPWEGDAMLNRPMFHKLMLVDGYFDLYREYLGDVADDYVGSGRCELAIREAAAMIAPYVERDATAFCSYDDFLLAVDTLVEICDLRAESIRGQLAGRYPATLRLREENPDSGVDASHVDIRDLGDFDDLRAAKPKQDAAVARIAAK